MAVRATRSRIVVGVAAVLLCVGAGGRGPARAEDNSSPAPQFTPGQLTPEQEALLKTIILDTNATPDEGPAPLTVQFSSEPMGNDESVHRKYVWNFGDHSKEARGEKVTHTFKKAGDYKVTVDVTADGDMAGSDWVFVTVTEPEKK